MLGVHRDVISVAYLIRMRENAEGRRLSHTISETMARVLFLSFVSLALVAVAEGKES